MGNIYLCIEFVLLNEGGYVLDKFTRKVWRRIRKSFIG